MRLFPSSPELSRHKSDQPSATPAEAGVHGSSVSFSEAFLNTSSARNTLPEQYRVHFDELRGNILAFCHEFKIPIETLRSKEAFGAELTSKRIPPERMAQVVSLFARLEHLVTHKEPLKEALPEHLREIERLYHLTEQYTSQVSLLERTGILKDGAITGIDGNKYPIPTLEQIASHLFEREKDLSIKRDQGFTKLLLVPFGMSLDALRETLKQFLLSYKTDHPAFDLDTNKPLYTWKEGYKGADTSNPPKIVYNPKSFDPGHHEGQTKVEILEEQAENPDSSFPGWRIHLLQPSNLQDNNSTLPKGFALIPREGQGQTHGEEIPHPSIEAGKSPIDYLSLLKEAQDNPDSPYFRESGLTPEDWIFAFITHLEETGKPLDDYQNNKESIAYLTGAFFPSINSSAFVPYAYWNRDFRQASLGRDGPRCRVGSFGVRSSVMI